MFINLILKLLKKSVIKCILESVFIFTYLFSFS